MFELKFIDFSSMKCTWYKNGYGRWKTRLPKLFLERYF